MLKLSRALLILLALSWSYPASAIAPVDSINNWLLYEFDKLDGGLNDSTNAISLKPNEASDLQNIIFPRTINGAISTRPGYTYINSTARAGTPDCTGIKFFKKADGTRYLVSLWSDDVIVKMDYDGSGPDGTWDDVTGSLSFNISQDDQADFSVAEDLVVITDGLGTNAPYSWNGTGNAAALTADADVPAASMLEYHVRHLFLAGDTSNPSRLYFSALDDITDYTSTDFIRVETDSGDGIIRGLKSGLDGLYIFKDSAIWRLSGTGRDSFILERMVQGIGTLSNRSISIVNDTTTNQQIFMFVTQLGEIAAYDGGVNVTVVSDNIKNSFPNSIAFNRMDEVVSTSYEDMYIVSASSSGNATHNRLYIFDFITSGWTRFVGMNANAISTFEGGNGNQLLMFADYDGFASQWDINDTSTFNDPGTTAIDAHYTTGWINFEQANVEKDVKVVRIFVNQEGNSRLLDFQVKKDFETTGSSTQIDLAGSGSKWDSAIYDTDTYADLTITIGRVEPGRGLPANLFQFHFENGARANERFKIRKFQVLVEPSDRV